MSSTDVVSDLTVTFLHDGAQPALRTAHQLAAFIGQAKHSLDIAIYDFVLSTPLTEVVGAALRAALGRGVQIRLVYEAGHTDPAAGPPPPGSTGSFVASLCL